MLLSIALTLALAAMKGYRFKKLLREFSLYPFFFMEAFLFLCQICVFFGIYTFIPFAGVIKRLFLASLLWPFFKFRLYKPGVVGAFLAFLGTALNKIAMSLNGGYMPVFPTISYWTGYTKSAQFVDTADGIHKLGDASVKVKFLTDIFDVGYSVLSIGDFLIHGFACILLYFTITAVCEKKPRKEGAVLQ